MRYGFDSQQTDWYVRLKWRLASLNAHHVSASGLTERCLKIEFEPSMMLCDVIYIIKPLTMNQGLNVEDDVASTFLLSLPGFDGDNPRPDGDAPGSVVGVEGRVSGDAERPALPPPPRAW